MIFPVSSDDTSPLRWPAVTLAIIVLCVAGTVFLQVKTWSSNRAIQERFAQLADYHDAHPDLQLPLAWRAAGATWRGVAIADPVAAAASLPEDRSSIEDSDLRRDQEQLDAFVRDMAAEHESAPARRFGFVGAKNNWVALATHSFMQPGWVHLVVCVWFLWLLGLNLEDRWGRLVYGPFYLLAAVVAAMANKALGAPDVPLLGAYAPISGAMGALLVLGARSRVPMMAHVLVRPIYFAVPAFIVILLWAGVLAAVTTLAPVGAAPWAWVAGFALGVLIALTLRLTGAENKLDTLVDRTVTADQDSRVMRAGRLVGEKRGAEALALMEAVALEKPSNIDVQLEMLRAAKSAGDTRREIETYGRLIELYMRAGAANTAMELYAEVRKLGREQELAVEDRIRVADRLAGMGRLHEAAEIYVRAYDGGLVDLTAIRALLGHAKVSIRLGRTDEARALYEQAQQSPFSTREIDEAIKRELTSMDLAQGARVER